MTGWLRRLFRRRPDAATAAGLFHARRGELLAEFLRAAAATGKPRGLRWVGAEPTGDAVFAAEAAGKLLALVPVTVRLEPELGGDMEDVPAARLPRPVTAVFAFDGRGWRATGRAVFNLSPAEAAGRFGLSPISELS